MKNSWVNIWIKIHKRKKLLTQLKTSSILISPRASRMITMIALQCYSNDLLHVPLLSTKYRTKNAKMYAILKELLNWAYSADKLSK